MNQEQYFRFLLFAILAFELPKPFFWMREEAPYHIFPQFGGPTTASYGIWLIGHQVTAIGLLLQSIYDWTKWEVSCLVHYLFLFYIALNSFRLFHCPPAVAFGINVTLCLALEYFKRMDDRFHYIIVLSLPLLFGPVVFLHFLISHPLSVYSFDMALYVLCCGIVSRFIKVQEKK